MKKLVFVWMLCACIGFGMTAEASGTLFNAYLPKAILSEEEAAREKIQMKPDMLKVVRQSVIPWDDEGTKWSVFIEVENESESKIVLDETWLIACDGEKEEFARFGPQSRPSSPARPSTPVILRRSRRIRPSPSHAAAKRTVGTDSSLRSE